MADEAVGVLADALAAEDGFAEVATGEDEVETVTLALLILEGDPAAGAAARHSALMMVKFSHPGVLGISVNPSYQYCGHSFARSIAKELCSAHHTEAELA